MDTHTIAVTVDGCDCRVDIDVRTTVLDMLRERLEIYSAKKGCDHGQCGACTVLLDGQRVLSCLLLAVTCDGARLTTSTGLAENGGVAELHEAIVRHDGLQCGYCTPGQVCSMAGLIREAKSGAPSYVSANLAHTDQAIDAREAKERLSGNLCRCGAYEGIINALLDVYHDPV